MNTDKLSHPVVKKAINALQAADKETWFSLFTSDATLYDDGNKMNFRSFFEKAFGHERFTSIDKVEDNGLAVYGRFHNGVILKPISGSTSMKRVKSAAWTLARPATDTPHVLIAKI